MCVDHYERRVCVYTGHQLWRMGKHTSVSSPSLSLSLTQFQPTVGKKSACEIILYLGIAASNTQFSGWQLCAISTYHG